MSTCSTCGKPATSCGCTTPPNLYTPGKPLAMSWADYTHEANCIPAGIPICVTDGPCPGIYWSKIDGPGIAGNLVMRREDFTSANGFKDGECGPAVDWDKFGGTSLKNIPAISTDCSPLQEAVWKDVGNGQYVLARADRPALPRGLVSLVQNVDGTINIAHDGVNYEELVPGNNPGDIVIRYKIYGAKATLSAEDWCAISVADNDIRVTIFNNITYFLRLATANAYDQKNTFLGSQLYSIIRVNGVEIVRNSDGFVNSHDGDNNNQVDILTDIFTTTGADVEIEYVLFWGLTVDEITMESTFVKIGDTIEFDMAQVLMQITDANDEIAIPSSVEIGPSEVS